MHKLQHQYYQAATIGDGAIMPSSKGGETINKTTVGENELSSMVTTKTIGETNARSSSAAKLDNTTSH